MAGKDCELERLRAEMDAAQRDIDSAKGRLDSISSKRSGIKSQIETINYRIADIKHHIDEEYRMMKICYEARDRIDAENHKYNAQSYKNSLQREYEIKNSYYIQLDGIKSEFESALYDLRSAKEWKQRAREAFQARLQILKIRNEQERAKWRVKSCKNCGKPIRYRVDWNHIPDLCKECKEREKAKWHEKPCKKCGLPIKYHEDWKHIPSICKQCKMLNVH